MNRYNNLNEIAEVTGLSLAYLKEVEYNFLGCEGSTIVNNIEDEPKMFTELNDKYSLGITAIEIEEDEYNYYYWIE